MVLAEASSRALSSSRENITCERFRHHGDPSMFNAFQRTARAPLAAVGRSFFAGFFWPDSDHKAKEAEPKSRDRWARTASKTSQNREVVNGGSPSAGAQSSEKSVPFEPLGSQT